MTIFSWPILPKKKKLEKSPFLDLNLALTLLEKKAIFRLFELLFFIAQKGVFSFQNIVKDIFLPYFSEKKEVGKMTIFGPKPWVNSFGKMAIFLLFELLDFIAQKGVFSFQNIVKDVFLTYIACKKELGKMAIFGPKPLVNPFGKKGNFLTFSTSLFL